MMSLTKSEAIPDLSIQLSLEPGRATRRRHVGYNITDSPLTR